MPTIARLLIGFVILLTAGIARYRRRNLRSADREAARVARAGFTEKSTVIDGVRLNYAEGPDHGPPLLLIHGQATDWRSWSTVLPLLATRHHVFAVDCHGHGASAHAPHKYSAKALATDLAEFVRQVIGQPVTVAGHSSGGLIAAAMAVDAGDVVRAVALEDPPFFSSVLPRATSTFNYVDLASTAHAFLHSGQRDFVSYYIRHGAVWDLFKGLAGPLRRYALACRARHPGAAVKLAAFPPSFNELFRALDTYDPRFGATFYDSSFHRGFDHAETLARIEVPAALIHARWSHDADGVLLAAMSGADAHRARKLLRDVTFHRVDTGHGFHLEDPGHFDRILADLQARVRPGAPPRTR